MFRKVVKGSEEWEKKREPRKEPAKQRAQRARKRSIVYDKGQRFKEEKYLQYLILLRNQKPFILWPLNLAMRRFGDFFLRSFCSVLKIEVYFQWTEGINK